MLQGRRNTAISLACVGSAHSVWPTLGLPQLKACVLFWSTLLKLQVALQGNCLKAGPGLCALPISKPLRFRFSGTPQRYRLGWACVLCPYEVRPARVIRCLGSALSPGGAVRLITSPSQSLDFLGAQQECSLRCAVCLLWGVDLWMRPSWWMSTIQGPRKTWLATGSLLAVW